MHVPCTLTLTHTPPHNNILLSSHVPHNWYLVGNTQTLVTRQAFSNIISPVVRIQYPFVCVWSVFCFVFSSFTFRFQLFFEMLCATSAVATNGASERVSERSRARLAIASAERYGRMRVVGNSMVVEAITSKMYKTATKSTRLCQLFIIRPQRTVLLMWLILYFFSFSNLFCEFSLYDGASLSLRRSGQFLSVFSGFFAAFFGKNLFGVKKMKWKERKKKQNRKKWCNRKEKNKRVNTTLWKRN